MSDENKNITDSSIGAEGSKEFMCPTCEKSVTPGVKFCPSCGTPIVHAPNRDDWIGRIVAGKYRIEELEGEGGMGQVFRATQLTLDKTIALKVLRKSLLSDARTVARFQREAKAASRLNHPNAINIIDFGQDSDDTLYIAMEHVSGRDLHQILIEEGPFPERRLIKIATQVLGALAEAHAVGVIHRDLKPENIMVEQRRDQTDFVKVLDFGIAKLNESAGGNEGQALTRAGFVCGTPEYMSPEQASGQEIDSRSDLYAVGVILYQCLTGVLPFDADSPVALATMHLTEEPVPPRQKNPKIHCSDGLERLILKVMSKSPDDRPKDAEQFRSELLSIEKKLRAQAKKEASAKRHERERSVVSDLKTSDNMMANVDSDWRSSSASMAEKRRTNETSAVVSGTNPEENVADLMGGKKPFAVGMAMGFLVLVIIALVLIDGMHSVTPESEMATGDELFFQKNYEEALTHYKNATELRPTPESLKREALVNMALGRVVEAKTALSRYQVQTGGMAPDREYVERYLESSKAPGTH